MEISFIHMQILVHLHVNKTNFHMKGFALGLALKQRRKATRKSPIGLFECPHFKSKVRILQTQTRTEDNHIVSGTYLASICCVSRFYSTAQNSPNFFHICSRLGQQNVQVTFLFGSHIVHCSLTSTAHHFVLWFKHLWGNPAISSHCTCLACDITPPMCQFLAQSKVWDHGLHFTTDVGLGDQHIVRFNVTVD